MTIRDTSSLGHAIRQLRQKAGLNQTELSDTASIRQRTVSDIERGSGAHTDTLFAILTALGMEIEIHPRRSKPFDPTDY